MTSPGIVRPYRRTARKAQNVHYERVHQVKRRLLHQGKQKEKGQESIRYHRFCQVNRQQYHTVARNRKRELHRLRPKNDGVAMMTAWNKGGEIRLKRGHILPSQNASTEARCLYGDVD